MVLAAQDAGRRRDRAQQERLHSQSSPKFSKCGRTAVPMADARQRRFPARDPEKWQPVFGI